MQGFIDFFSNLLDAQALLESFGPWVLGGLTVIIFIESGLLFPFLPGDSMIVTAAILREALGLSMWQILVFGIVAAVLGDQVGYYLGHRFGRKLFKPDARILKTEYLDRAEEFFERRGPLALVLGRFIPIVRTYVPLAAGTAKMHYSHFVGWNVAGGVTWVCLMSAVGYFLGGFPVITENIEAIMLIIIVISVLPIVISWVNAKIKARRAAKGGVEVAGSEGGDAA